MTNAFLQWPLPTSVCADLCSTKQGEGRIGTNLLSYIEAKEMFETIAKPHLSKLKAQREDMCVLITRLCRQSYKLGVKNKLTNDAMKYINSTDAENTPATRILRKIISLPVNK